VIILRCALAVPIMIACIAGAASAQYFGQNKVQYRTHEFRVLQTEHFDIYFHQSREEAVEVAGRLAERWRRRLSTIFGFELSGRQPIVLYSSKPDFDQTSVVSGLIDGGTAGLTEPTRRRIALPFAASLADTDHVLGHEIVHAFQFDLLTTASPSVGGQDGEPLALWVIEGLAEYLTLGPVEPHTAMWLRDAVRRRALPRVADLGKPEYFPYRWGHAFWAYVGAHWGDRTATHLFSVAVLVGMRSAMETVLGITTEEFSERWHEELRATYPPVPSAAVGTHIAGAKPVGGSVNVGAAISPDGRWVAYLTERLFGVDLVVADAKTGTVAATLTDTAADPHYSSLQYIGSAAAWGPDGRRLSIATLTSGRPALSIFSWPGGRREQDVVIDGVDEIFGPAWSPDGRAVAFSGMSQGATDLFVFDLERSSLRRLTDDLFADLQPVWSPDGRTLAFVTDRFTTNLETLTTGQLRLATIDIAVGDVRPIDAFGDGKHISPQWSRDGRTLYFISDSGGGPNVYALDLAQGALARLTEAESGVAGLTASSPALSIAVDADTAAVTVYEAGTFAVHTLALTDGVPASANAGARSAPDDAAPPRAESWRVSKYRARLALEDMTEAAFGAGVGMFGATAAGGLALTFADILRTHWLTGAVQVSNPFGAGFSLRDVAGYGAYFNQSQRWHWGVAASSVPTFVGVRTGLVGDGGLGLFGPFVLVRQVERAVQGAVSYPFSRARRIELNGGFTNLSYDEMSGFLFGGSWTQAAAPMTLGQVGAAFVSDTSHAGATSMVSGERYRLEVSPVAGDLRYLHVNADYRRYLMPSPFYTVAFRALHAGRYGRGADDTRVAPLFLGYPWLVRGFDPGWSAVNECVTVLSAGCPELDDLLGSRLAVGNVELRLPLLRPFGLSRSMYGPVPVEVAVFADAGVAWQSMRPPKHAVLSAGVTLRTSLLGFGLGQFHIVRPLGPAARGGWTVRFNLAPAF
jgi:Tol biopolymer transport system component